MNFLGNIIWFLLGGFLASILWLIAGLIVCLTIIGIPFGMQLIKIASFVIWPFGSEVKIGEFGFGGLIGNILWIIFVGWELCIFHLILSLVFSISIVGIPFGVQHFKFAKLALLPFGARIRR